MKLRIAFDLDGCLLNIAETIKKIILETYGIEFKKFPKEKDQFDWKPATGLSDKELWKIFRQAYKRVEETPVFHGATELLAKLYEVSNEPPFILTARPLDTATEAYAAVEHVAKGIPFNLALKHPLADKIQYLNGYDFFVEDRRKTAIELNNSDIATLLIRRNYNHIPNIEEYRHIYYIDGVADLIPYIHDFVY